MATRIQKVIKDIKELSANDRALVAHCLISSLETGQDENVEETWADLAEARFAELMSGEVTPITWEEVKQKVKG